MKRKTKIITTIASLCLAVALMAFGVYAATSAVLGVTSKVSFVAKDVDVTWNIKVSGGNVDPSKGAAANSDEDDYQPWADAAGYTLRFNTLTGDEAGSVGTEGENIAVALTPQGLGLDEEADDFYSFNTTAAGVAGTGLTITYTFTMTNNGGDAVDIAFAVNDSKIFATESGALTVEFKQGLTTASTVSNWASYTTGVAKNGVYVYQVTLTLVDRTLSLSADQELDISFTVTRHDA